MGWIVLSSVLASFLVVEKPLASADAIYVLGGSSTFVERAEKAAEEYRKGVAGRVYIVDDFGRAGWSKEEQQNPTYTELTIRVLKSGGVPEDSISVIKPIGSGTIYEARLFKDFAERENLKKVVLVTSAYHTRRSFWTFQTEMPEVEFGVVYTRGGRKMPSMFSWWFTPFGWSLVLPEYVKFIVYSVFY